jgi:hypothetical protein
MGDLGGAALKLAGDLVEQEQYFPLPGYGIFFRVFGVFRGLPVFR